LFLIGSSILIFPSLTFYFLDSYFLGTLAALRIIGFLAGGASFSEGNYENVILGPPPIGMSSKLFAGGGVIVC
jgi:hypothetical protein